MCWGGEPGFNEGSANDIPGLKASTDSLFAATLAPIRLRLLGHLGDTLNK